MTRGDQLRGINRERQVAARLTAENWWVMRAAGSKGVADLVCLKAGRKPLMLEIKSTAAGPFAGFGPAKREDLRLSAEQSGATPFLVWWPSHGKEVWLGLDEWPPDRRGT